MIQNKHPNWKVPQWIAFLKDKEIPILQKTKYKLSKLYDDFAYNLEPKTIADFSHHDPLFALRVLILSEKKRKKNYFLNNDTKTILNAVMHVGIKNIIDDCLSAEVCVENEDLLLCISRAVNSAYIGRYWANYRVDVCPEEISLATILVDLGELLLLIFEPTIPQIVYEEILSGRILRNKEAQLIKLGFGFKELSIGLAEVWNLPIPIKNLMLGSQNNRAKLSKCAVEVSRHLAAKNGLVAIPDDIKEVISLMPSVNIEDLLKPLQLNDYQKDYVLSRV